MLWSVWATPREGDENANAFEKKALKARVERAFADADVELRADGGDAELNNPGVSSSQYQRKLQLLARVSLRNAWTSQKLPSTTENADFWRLYAEFDEAGYAHAAQFWVDPRTGAAEDGEQSG